MGCMGGCAFADTRKALAATTVVVILLMLMGGLFIPLSQIPVRMQWIKFLSIFSYANNASLALIFRVPTPRGGDHQHQHRRVHHRPLGYGGQGRRPLSSGPGR